MKIRVEEEFNLEAAGYHDLHVIITVTWAGGSLTANTYILGWEGNFGRECVRSEVEEEAEYHKVSLPSWAGAEWEWIPWRGNSY